MTILVSLISFGEIPMNIDKYRKTHKPAMSSTLNMIEKNAIDDHVLTDCKHRTVWDFIYNTWIEQPNYADDVVSLLVSEGIRVLMTHDDLETLVIGALIEGGPYLSYEVQVIKDLLNIFSAKEVISMYHKAGRFEPWVQDCIEPLLEEIKVEDNDTSYMLENFNGPIPYAKIINCCF
jgi:hypothetical protein